MKNLLTFSLFFMSMRLVMALPFANENQEPTEAFVCQRCDLLEAERIAIKNAPESTCNLYQNESNVALCEPVSKEILIPVQHTQLIFRFKVTTSIGEQDLPVVNVQTLPLTATQEVLMNQYFDFYNEFKLAVGKASISSAELSPLPIFITNAIPKSVGIKEDVCASHPAYYFSNDTNKLNIHNELADRIENSIEGMVVAEYSETLFPRESFLNISRGTDKVEVNMQYVEDEFLVFRGDDFNNRLAFSVHKTADPTVSNKVVFNFSLNKAFTKIDGFKYGEIFGGGSVDLEGVIVSNCLLNLLNENSEEDLGDTPTSGGGDGSFSDPFTGVNIPTANPHQFCKFSRKYENCNVGPNGNQQCTSSNIKWVAPCGEEVQSGPNQ